MNPCGQKHKHPPLDPAGGIWILAEQRDGIIKNISYELLNWGRELADKKGVPLSALLISGPIEENEIKKLIYHGADRVYLVEHQKLKDFLVQPYSNIMVRLIQKYKPEIIISGATTMGRTLLPYAASMLCTGLTADCTGLAIDDESGDLLQTRPAIGGNIMATIKTPNTRPQMSTVRPKSRAPLSEDKSRTGDIITEEALPSELASNIKKAGFIPKQEESGIQEADVVVSGGRGMKTAENYKHIIKLAELLNGAAGASRDVVDMGWAPYFRQIGLSGKTVTPKLYMAFGISGSVQHLAGMQTSEHIIAINKDPDVRIFKVADLGIAADLFDILPRLVERLEERRDGNK